MRLGVFMPFSQFSLPILYRLLGDPLAAEAAECAETAKRLADCRAQLYDALCKQRKDDVPVRDPDAAMSVDRAAKRLAVSKGIIYRLCQEGEMPHNKIGRRVTITPAQLDEFRNRQSSPASSQLRYV
jgi:excisionase family DNA binding protein